MTPRQSRILVVASLLALVLLTWGRIVLVGRLHDQGYFTKYVDFADAILAGNLPHHRIGDVSPAYLWLIVALRACGLGVLAIRNLQIVALSLATLLIAIAAKRLGGRIAALTAALLILGNKAALVTATELEPETLIFVLTSAAILALVARRTVPAALFLGLSLITRPVAALTLALVTLWTFLRLRRDALLMAAIGLVPAAIVLVVNLALTGSAIVMQPGTVFYEGNNALSIGGAGVTPRIVADLEATATEADYLHVAYRMIEARATGGKLDSRRANRYWSGKALAWMRTYPAASARLFALKALHAIHIYDIYDLATMTRKDDELGQYPSIPFALAVTLAVAALVLRSDRRELVPLALFAVATMVSLVLFNVTARQRNAMLPALAVLAGAGASEIVRKRSLLALGGVLIATPLLGIETDSLREDRYNWAMTFHAERLHSAAVAARERHDTVRATELAAAASIADSGEAPLVRAENLRTIAIAAVPFATLPEQRFDLAIALLKAGAYREAHDLLPTVEGYRPHREGRAVSSVAYYRARADAHLGARPNVLLQLLDEAETEAPGDADVLAFRAVLGDAAARARLDALHDPFTRDLALANAYADLGDPNRANALIGSLRTRFPEWTRPQRK